MIPSRSTVNKNNIVTDTAKLAHKNIGTARMNDLF